MNKKYGIIFRLFIIAFTLLLTSILIYQIFNNRGITQNKTENNESFNADEEPVTRETVVNELENAYNNLLNKNQITLTDDNIKTFNTDINRIFDQLSSIENINVSKLYLANLYKTQLETEINNMINEQQLLNMPPASNISRNKMQNVFTGFIINTSNDNGQNFNININNNEGEVKCIDHKNKITDCTDNLLQKFKKININSISEYNSNLHPDFKFNQLSNDSIFNFAHSVIKTECINDNNCENKCLTIDYNNLNDKSGFKISINKCSGTDKQKFYSN